MLEAFPVLTLARVREQLDHLRRQAAIHRASVLQKPPPDWTLEIFINGRTPITVHAGECGMGGSRSSAFSSMSPWSEP
ncbi:hypothetical protein [Streptomyces sp. NPDC059881]|uniref:hypothetical protein n=1 Tax=Streptomyces sp. NPDC059881 TaxID=3346986 RepID=UPI00364E343D